MIFTGRGSEVIGVARTGASLRGRVDPSARLVYLPEGADVARGDVLSVRGWTRRVVDLPQGWTGFGLVVGFEDGPAYLPDTGVLERHSSTYDEDTNLNTDTWSQVWSGPCRVDVVPVKSSGELLAEQVIQLQPFTVTFPLSLIDVEPGDRLHVTASRDGRLLVRRLFVQRTLAGSLAQDRIVLAKEEQ